MDGDGADRSREDFDSWHAERAVDAAADAPWHVMLRPFVEQFVPGAEVLEIGCGRGGYAATLWANRPAALTATDFSPVAVTKAAEFLASIGASGVTTRVEDACALTFADNSFDVVISCEMVEHVLEPQVAIREMARVLRPSGRLLLSTPNYLSLTGVMRAYYWLRRVEYQEEGQPINQLVLAPRTRRWLEAAGLTVERTLGDGLYLPIPRRTSGPLRVDLGRRASTVLRPVLLHSAFVARKPS